MPYTPRSPEKRASGRKSVRKYTQLHGHPRDRRERGGNGTDLHDVENGSARAKGDTYEQAVWLRAQRAALDLAERMDGLISRRFAVERLAEIAKRIEERMLRIPSRCAARLAAEEDPMRVRAILEAEVRLARH